MYDSFIISLKEPTEKLEYLKSQGLFNTVWVEGVDGSKLTNEDILKHGSSMFKYLAPKSAIGIALAHAKAWQTFLKQSNQPFGLFFEDDVVLNPNFCSNLETILQSYLPSDTDILYLGCFGCDPKHEHWIFQLAALLYGQNKQCKRINDFIYSPKHAYGLHCYLLTRSGAQKLVNLTKQNLYAHIDSEIQDLISNKQIIAYVTIPRLAYQTSTDTLDSTNLKGLHPYILQYVFNQNYIDQGCKVNYVMNSSFAEIGGFTLNFTAVFFFIFGLIACAFRVPPYKLTIAFIMLSLPDISNLIREKTKIITIKAILWHYVLFLLPSWIQMCYQRGKKSFRNIR